MKLIMIMGLCLVVFLAMSAMVTAASAAPRGVAAWGYGFYGQLGNGSIANSDVPVAVCATGAAAPCPTGPYLSGVKAVSTGGDQSLALLRNRTVMAWGYNNYGQLGNGTEGGFSDLPVAVSGLSGSRPSQLA